MKRLSLLAMKTDKEDIYNALIRCQAVELKRTEDIADCCVSLDTDACNDIAEKIKRVDDATAYVGEVVEQYNAICAKSQAVVPAKNTFARPKTELSFDDFVNFSHRATQIEADLTQLFQLRERISQLKQSVAQNDNEQANLQPYKNLPHPTTWYADTDCALVRLCLLPSSEWQNLVELANTFQTVEVEQLDVSLNTSVVAVVAHKADVEFLQKSAALGLVQSNFVCQQLPSQQLEQLIAQRKQLDKQIAQAQSQVAHFAEKLLDFKVYADYLDLIGKKLAADGELQQTNATFVLEGYYPKDKEDDVLAAIQGVTDCVEVYTYEIGEQEFAPTLTKNNAVVRQFEFVTDNYTPPDYHEIDPNPVMSFFYFAIFGLMVADIGYGLLLCLAGLFAHFAIKQRTGMRTMLQMFGICGVAAVVVGAMFGSFFSFPLQSLFSWWPVIIPDPSVQPMVMMMISLLFGVIHITAGVACNMAVKYKRHCKLSAWLVDFPWIITFAAFIVAILNPALDMVAYDPYMVLKVPQVVADVALYVCLGSLAVAVLCAGLDSKGIIGKAISSFGAAYGLINYFSDIMSYIRVFGLMLSSALMGQVINQLAGMVLGNGGIGYLFAAVLLVFAHLFNLLMGILGVYIHDGRLQYVEFFGKFYTGDGHTFVPFGSDLKYTLLK